MTASADIAYRNYLATTSNRSESAAGYAMWDAAMEACARVADNYASQVSTGVMMSDRESTWKEISGNEIAAAIRSFMTTKGPTEQERAASTAKLLDDKITGSAPSAPPPGEGGIEEAALREIIRIKDDTLGTRFPGEPLNQHETELRESFDRGCRMAFYRCADIATSALRHLTQPQNAK